MKMPVTTALTILLAAALFSCSEEFFHKEPQGITAENVFTNEKGIEALLLGTYGIISGGALWEVTWGASVQNWTYGSVASDDAYKGSEVWDRLEINDIERWNVSPDNPYPAEVTNINPERAGNDVVMGRVQIHDLPPGVYPYPGY